MDLIYFFRILLRRKWLIIGLALLAAIAAFVFLYFKPALYKSQAQYSTGFTAEKVRLVDGSSGIDIYTADVKFNNAIETFKSPKVINMIAYKLLLHDLSKPKEAYRKLSKKQMDSKIYKAVDRNKAIQMLTAAISTDRLLDSKTEQEKLLIEYFDLYHYDYESLLADLAIERVGRTDYLNTTFWSENPNLSALIVNAMGQEFLNYYKNLSSQRTEENAEGIKRIVTEQQTKIDSLGKQLYNAKVSQGSIDPVSLSTSAMETVKELETSLAQEKSKQNEHFNRKKYLTERLQTLQASASSAGGNNDEIIRLNNKKNDLVEELTRKGGKDADLEQQIADIRNQISAKSTSTSVKVKPKDLDDLRVQISEEDALLNAANSTVADYTSRISKYTGLANTAPVGSDVTISGIKSKLDIENSQLGIVMEKYSQAQGLVKDDPTANFIQTAVGQPAIGPESKKTLLIMILSAMSMFFITSIIILMKEIFDPKLKTPALFKKQVKFRVSNILNNVPLNKTSETDIILNDLEGKKYSREILFKNNIRKLRHELINSTDHVFLFTSTQRKTGKTTVIDSLAAALVLSKKSVLIIDMNFENNTLTQKYNPQAILQEIAGKINYERLELNHDIWTNTATEGLSVIGNMKGNFTPTEALASIDLKAFFALLKKQFDYILIEGAALNDYADSFELAAYADAVFTVFSAAASISHADDKALNFITSLGVKNKGAILNNVLKENINF